MYYSNVIQLNYTRGKIESCYFKGRNSTYHDPTLQIDSEQIIDDTWTLCLGQSTYYSSTTHGLVYLTKGSYEIESDQFEQSQIGAVKVDTSDVIMKAITLIQQIKQKSILECKRMLITFIIIFLKWTEIKNALLNRENIQKICNQEDELEEYGKKKQELKNQKKLIKKLTQKKSHLDISMSYEYDQPVKYLYGINNDIFSDITSLAKDVKFLQEEGYINRQQTSLYSPSLELESWKSSPSIFEYIQNLQSKLDDYESLNVRKISPGLELPLKGQKVQIEMPDIEEDTLNQQITGYFINSKPVSINFSSINSDDPQFQGINLGCVFRPPTTIGLTQQGITSPPKEILDLQKRLEQFTLQNIYRIYKILIVQKCNKFI
ncbi:MAG: hypothetical protein EZS28_029557 [Streblomastix strix]|uniref:Uncharacterized protein n=1 Tax=Streblomastix strix TaxID=222440 RepID=A0A5J4UX80_9EUKA|nr:MAG: hypothetical protein EZS28_029557 [Streblomastix strix]